MRLVVINDYELVVAGVAGMLKPFSDRVTVVEATTDPDRPVQADVALIDTFGNPWRASRDLRGQLGAVEAHRVVVYSWDDSGTLVEDALAAGADGYLSKGLPASDLVAALLRVYAGERVVGAGPTARRASTAADDWPGRSAGLSRRQSEVLAMASRGLTTAEIADELYLSVNTVRSYFQVVYRHVGVHSRSQLVLWSLKNGFVGEGPPEPPSASADGSANARV